MPNKLKIAIGLVAGVVGAIVTYEKSQDVIDTVEGFVDDRKNKSTPSDSE